MTGHRQSVVERAREGSPRSVGFFVDYVSRIPPFFREMPDRFTGVITRFRRFSANRMGEPLSSNRFSPSYFHYSYSRSHFAAPNVFSRSLPEFFVSPSSVRFDIFQIPRSIVVARYSSKVTSIDKHQFSWNIAENERQVSVSVASACREWSRSSCAMVDRTVDASNTIYFSRGNGMEIETRS